MVFLYLVTDKLYHHLAGNHPTLTHYSFDLSTELAALLRNLPQ
jgi:hypothetical protein